jgi:TonB family protein
MPALTLLLAAALAQVQTPTTDCAIALTRGTSAATAQVCQAESELSKAQAEPKGGSEWTRHLEAAMVIYRRTLALSADEIIKATILERLLAIFDEPMLNRPVEREEAFRDLVALKPNDTDPLLRYAQFQERQGSLDAAEDMLLSARRLQPTELEPYRRLAQFYARRASALHARMDPLPLQEQTPPGTADKDGVFRVGGGVTPPRRFGNAIYPADASASGIEGVVVAEITVNESGIVTDARVLKSVPLLDEAALQAVKEWRYDPTLVNGKPVPIKMTVTVNFSTRR